jgi:hypothetical protein
MVVRDKADVDGSKIKVWNPALTPYQKILNALAVGRI